MNVTVRLRRKRVALNLFLILTLVLLGQASVFAQGPDRAFTPRPLAPESSFHSATAKESDQARAGVAATEAATTTTGDRLVSVIVKLDDASLAAYQGGVPGLAPTSPQATGAAELDPASPASQRYLAYLAQQQSAFEANVAKAVPAARVTHRFQVVFGGVAMLVPESQVSAIARQPGVRAVYRDELLQPDTERSPFFIGADHIWDALGGQENAAEGVIVGVLDTGIWPEHPSFSDPDPLGNAYPEPPDKWNGTTCAFSGGSNPGAPFTCNNKLIGAYRFMQTYDLFGPPLLPGEFTSARDDNGHGTHTASTAAGNAGVQASIFGLPRGTVSGIAPRAHVVMYKVCGDAGCFTSDSVAAIEQAIADGVDAINFSISGGNNPYSDAVELAFLDAYAAGVFVAASAGNSGPGPDTVNHRGPWVTTVGASTTDRHFLSTLTVTAGNGDTLTLIGATVTDGIDTPTPVVFPPEGEELCLEPFPAGTFDGEIVVCQRGVIARVEKSYNVAAGGAGGLILYNPVQQGLNTDNHFIPSIHIDGNDGATLLEFLDSHTGETATFTAGTASDVQGDVMAAFSSRGGPGQSLGVNKPDVTAPGVQILAGNSPQPATVVSGVPGELFQAIQGTSMSSPHVAGAGALLKALHPDWTPGQIKSALMTTAKTEDVFKEDGVTPADPFDFGSGRIDLTRAGDPGLTISASAEDFLVHQNDLWNANYPSLYVPVMAGRITVQRSIHSELSRTSAWMLSVTAPPDVKVIVPKSLLVRAGQDKAFNLTVDARNVPLGEVRHATLHLKHDGYEAHLPITIVRAQPAVTLDKSCEPATLPMGLTTTCTISATNTSFDDATIHLVDRLPRQLDLVEGSVSGATAAGNGVVFDGTLAGAEPPDVTIAAGTSPAGYLPLSVFGIPPIGGIGDETIVNFTVPPFTYAGESYSRIGLVSNGYAVVGGGTGADVQFINQSLPNPSPPNNVLAPFWTDLNPASGGALRAATLTDGADTWIVLEWQAVREFSQPKSNSFQIWIGVDGDAHPGQDISFAYGPIEGNGDGGLLTVGAENRFGNRGANYYFNGAGTLPANGTELRVTSVPGTPGETHVVTFSAEGRVPGKWVNCAQMTADIFFGTNIDCFAGRVTR